MPLRHAVCTLKPREIHDVRTKAVNMDSWSFTVTLYEPISLVSFLSISVSTDDMTHVRNCQAQPCESSSNKTHSCPEIIVCTSKQEKRFMRLFGKREYTSSPLSPAKYCSWHEFGSVLFVRLWLWWGAQTSTETSNNPSLKTAEEHCNPEDSSTWMSLI